MTHLSPLERAVNKAERKRFWDGLVTKIGWVAMVLGAGYILVRVLQSVL